MMDHATSRMTRKEALLMTNTESARVLYARTRDERFAIGAFNVDNQETLIAIARAAAARKSPVLVEATPWRGRDDRPAQPPCDG